MSAQGYTLPATAVCPGCGRLVVLPAEPLYPDTPPAICATCDTEIPDYRREAYSPSAHLGTTAAEPVDATPMEDRRYSRKGLFKSLGGLVAERGLAAAEAAKDRFNN
jgi:hypothetical protein